MTTPAPRIAPELATATALLAAAATGYALAHAGTLPALVPTPGLHGTATEFAAIAARNSAVALVFLGATQLHAARRRPAMLAVDALGLAVLLPVTLIVGQFLASGAGAWRYFVHAPLELGALAAAYGWWWRHHETAPPAARATARRALALTAALTIAAAVETFLVPHRAA